MVKSPINLPYSTHCFKELFLWKLQNTPLKLTYTEKQWLFNFPVYLVIWAKSPNLKSLINYEISATFCGFHVRKPYVLLTLKVRRAYVHENHKKWQKSHNLLAILALSFA